MEIKFGRETAYGHGVKIILSGDEIATAIDTYLAAHGIIINGARTINVNGELCKEGQIYVDPSGKVIANGREFSYSSDKIKEIKK
jgi:hypothetical protein